jgi:hypothetical protein
LRSPKGIESLGSPVFIFATALLVLNDFVFKAAFHNGLTGKLSDFAGLAAFTIFLCAFWPDRKRTLAVGVSAAFIFWKSPFSQSLIDWVNGVSPVPIGRIVDYTDLVALPVVWWACACAPLRAWPARRWLLQAFAGVSIAAFTATSIPSHYGVREAFDVSRSGSTRPASELEGELQQLIDEVVAEHGLRCEICDPLSSGRWYAPLGTEKGAWDVELSLAAAFDPRSRRLFYHARRQRLYSFRYRHMDYSRVDALRADLDRELRSRFPGVLVLPSHPLQDSIRLVVSNRSSSRSYQDPENQADARRAFAIVAEVAAGQGLKRFGETQIFHAGRLWGPEPYEREMTVTAQITEHTLVLIYVSCATPDCREWQRATARVLERRLHEEFGKARAGIRMP